MISTKWHTLAPEDVFEQLQSEKDGLSEKEAALRLKQYGINSIKQKKVMMTWHILVRQLCNPIVYVLLFSTLLSLVLQKFADAGVVFAVVVLNTLIGFIQEYKAHAVIKSLTAMVPHTITVVRKEGSKVVSPTELVPGDVVNLQAGDQIPADLRLFMTKNFQCDESMLTGESLPVDKSVAKVSEHTTLAERKCMAYMGTNVTAGTALGIVAKTGIHTELGKISTLLSNVQSLETPLTATLKKIATFVTVGVLAVSAVLFVVGYFRGDSLFNAAFSAVALAVAAIPEGLPAIITIASSIGVRRMARKQAIIRQLPAVEALGSTSIICTDKTGTLTYNEMTVQKIWTPSGEALVTGGGYAPEGTLQGSYSKDEMTALLQAAVLCNDASFNNLMPLGDPTEIALVVCGRKAGVDEKELRRTWTRDDMIPFESEKRIMITLNSSHERFYFLKGAPEEVLSRCTQVDPKEILARVEEMAKMGMRVLAIARKQTSASTIEENEIASGFTLLGLVGMIDPPRKEVYQALKACHEAGITVKMITGDHPLTAEAIGRDLGIASDTKPLSGIEMDTFTDEQWFMAARNTHVFARAAPEHKLKIVTALQAGGDVVAMTGDGVNDGAALKRADIGVAMGIKGTSVAKEAADIVLADDNFASIEAAVEEGRRVYDNLIKSLAFLIPTNLGQALVILSAVLFFPIYQGILLHPIQPIQILWVNLVVAVCLSLPLAFEEAEPDIMKRPPRKKSAPVLSRFLLIKTLLMGLVIAGGTVGLFLWEYLWESRQGISHTLALAEAQTMAVTAIILFQILYLFQCRSLKKKKGAFFSNPYVFVGVAIVLAAQLAFIYLPSLNALFHTAPLDLQAWAIVIVVSLVIIPINGLMNRWRE